LASFYVGTDVQEQRREAVAAFRGVMDAIREKRAEFSDTFPEDLIAWTVTNNEASWASFLADNSAHIELSEQTLVVDCFNQVGDAAGVGDNPIVVHVTSTWQDRRGHTLSATVVSILTGE
ncbi:MAG: hypothetical protein L3K26_16810, partial [Candidatus Hydrogenedentes bacterium]|nr:hypothetical protein [Candidatus Hydrogenedentota bacterium]